MVRCPGSVHGPAGHLRMWVYSKFSFGGKYIISKEKHEA